MLSPTEIYIYWQPPPLECQNGNIDYYVLRITELDTGNTFEVVSNFTWILLDFLHPYYTYSVQFAAVTVAQGPFGASITFTTPEDGERLATLYIMLI